MCPNKVSLFFRFGNFLCNNIHDRQKLSVATVTVSLWAHLKADEESFRNPTYRKYTEVGWLALFNTQKKSISYLSLQYQGIMTQMGNNGDRG